MSGSDERSCPPAGRVDNTVNIAPGARVRTVVQGGVLHGDLIGNAGRTALDEPLRVLAREVRTRWKREEARVLREHEALPVRWEAAPDRLSGHWHGDRADAPIDLSGVFDEEANGILLTYGALPWGRLVVLGPAGSGKTVLTVDFVLRVLAERQRGGRRAGGPVPVRFDLGAWDPSAIGLRNWLIERLAHDYPQPGGRRTAADLVDSELILPVLDGFDEIAEPRRGTGLRAISRHEGPLLMTSREAEYAALVDKTGPVKRSAAIRLVELDEAGLIEHLARGGVESGRRWRSVLRGSPADPDGAASRDLLQVLRNPLMASLARTAYREDDARPAELLDRDRFPTQERLKDHLLQKYVPTVYDDELADTRPIEMRWPWTQEQVQPWFRHLATHLVRRDLRPRSRPRSPGPAQDLAWWKIADDLPRRTRMLVVALVTGAVVGVVVFLGHSALFVAGGNGVPASLVAGAANGFLNGTMAGPGFGLAHGARFVFRRAAIEPSHVRFRFRRGPRRPDSRSFRTIATRAAVALLLGTVFGFCCGFVPGLLRAWSTPEAPVLLSALVDGLLFAAMFGIGAGLVLFLAAIFDAPLDIGAAASPEALLAANRRTALVHLLLFGPAFGMCVGFSGFLVVELLGGGLWGLPLTWSSISTINFGVLGGAGGGLGAVLALSAWGEWVVFGRIWLPLRGRLPWRTITFLTDAHERGVLRRHGPVYQFRHALFRDHLAG
ncbi:NTPase [Saccharopolyspora sp. 6V]|uniref:NTPase n=1 Tax=Saccharopolyspora sp. 6V TaxID=2877239 RepID=UPI001CD2EFEF|nr:NTPase [Saccharopolyspora sp. 6V]MCA1191425.1 NTPase [Saccharopolyspora sp. 6V]